jgi:hypothetical protein
LARTALLIAPLTLAITTPKVSGELDAWLLV